MRWFGRILSWLRRDVQCDRCEDWVHRGLALRSSGRTFCCEECYREDVFDMLKGAPRRLHPTNRSAS